MSLDVLTTHVLQHCVLISDDSELVHDVTGYLGDLFRFSVTQSSPEALSWLDRRSHCIAIVDLRTDGALALSAALSRRKPGCLTIAMGEPKSHPFREAGNLDIFAVFDVNAPSTLLQSLMVQAARQLELVIENQVLTQQIAEFKSFAKPPALPAREPEFKKIEVISDVLRELREPLGILKGVLEDLSGAFLATSVGTFVLFEGRYSLKAGLRCPEEAWRLHFDGNDRFIRWLRAHGQIISRKGLRYVDEVDNKLLLSQTLDSLGAEIVVPITKGSSLLGWISLGKRTNGEGYEKDDHSKLLRLSDQIADIVDALRMVEEKSQQQRILTGMAAAIPSGLLLVDPLGRIAWSNEEARRLLKLSEEDIQARPEIDRFNSFVADAVNRAAAKNGQFVGADSRSSDGAHFSISARRLESRGDEIGVMVLLEETPLRIGAQRIKPVEDPFSLPASDIPFRIRSALSAIRSFNQLIAERHEDPEFLANFGALVESEINNLIELSKALPQLEKSL